MKENILRELWDIIESRKGMSSKESWTAQLLNKGTAKICKKVGEEATEVVIAALAEKKKHLVAESADLLYHLLVLWADKDIEPDNVYAELEKRFGISGIEEKDSRKEDTNDL
ncbi:MAG: phosphoribosyl-ATP diphosphatase [Alphaproteobacteria bacterium]